MKRTDEELEDIILRMKVTKLESKLALLEIERTALRHEVASRSTLPHRRVEVFDRCDQIEFERTEIIADLDSLRHPMY